METEAPVSYMADHPALRVVHPPDINFIIFQRDIYKQEIERINKSRFKMFIIFILLGIHFIIFMSVSLKDSNSYSRAENGVLIALTGIYLILYDLMYMFMRQGNLPTPETFRQLYQHT